LGSAVKHPHDLVLGYYSVHTSKAALAQGEAEIQRIGSTCGMRATSVRVGRNGSPRTSFLNSRSINP
jgi:hypothetical protein